MRYEGDKIVISEQELKWLVNESVNNILTENAEDETFWGGLQNAARGFTSGNWNFRQLYKVGNQASTFAKYATAAQNSIAKMMEIAKETQNANIATSLSGISKNMQTVADSFTKQARDLAKPQEYSMKVNNPWKKPATRTRRTATTGTGTGTGATTVSITPPTGTATRRGGRRAKGVA